MSDLLGVTYVLLWVVVIALTFLVLVLYRQVGEMYLGGKQGRTRDGILIGSRVPAFHADDQQLRVAELPLSRPTVLVFAMPDCSPCRALMPDLARFARSHERDLATVVVAGPDREQNERFASELGPDVPVLQQLGLAITTKYRVRSTPFAFYLDEAGVVRSKGITNRLVHLEQLVSRGQTATPTSGEPVVAHSQGGIQ
jgi:methylamine dehydrogenase accessory protein MauD